MKKYVKIILVIALMIAGKQVHGQTVALLTSSDISRTVNVSVSVAKKAKIEVVDAANSVYVDDEDIRKGFIDIPGAVVLKVWCNSIDGAKVMAQITPVVSGNIGKLMCKLSEEPIYNEAGNGFSGIYESCKVERGSEISLDIRYMLAANSPIGEYQFEASFVAEPK